MNATPNAIPSGQQDLDRAPAGAWHTSASDGDFVVQTRGLTKRYDDATVAVDGLDLRVRRGEVYGFLGPNGAGKTTTLRMLLGLVRPTSGQSGAAVDTIEAPTGQLAAVLRLA